MIQSMSEDALWGRLTAFRQRVLNAMRGEVATLTELGMSLSQSMALFAVGEYEPVTISQLQTLLHRSQATTSHLVNQLASKGLAARRQAPSDARRSAVFLTRRGRALVERVEALRQKGFQRVLGGLPRTVRRQLDAALKATLDALDKTL